MDPAEKTGKLQGEGKNAVTEYEFYRSFRLWQEKNPGNRTKRKTERTQQEGRKYFKSDMDRNKIKTPDAHNNKCKQEMFGGDADFIFHQKNTKDNINKSPYSLILLEFWPQVSGGSK